MKTNAGNKSNRRGSGARKSSRSEAPKLNDTANGEHDSIYDATKEIKENVGFGKTK